jgi:hypothetical protein
MRGPMERTFEADTREQPNQKTDEWRAKAKGLRFVHLRRLFLVPGAAFSHRKAARFVSIPTQFTNDPVSPLSRLR